LLALTAGLDLGWTQLMTYTERVIDIVVQIERRDGRRAVSEVRFRR